MKPISNLPRITIFLTVMQMLSVERRSLAFQSYNDFESIVALPTGPTRAFNPTTGDVEPGQPSYFRFSQHRHLRNNVQTNEFYRVSMNATLVPCNKEDSHHRPSTADSADAASSVMFDDALADCQHRIKSKIYIEPSSKDADSRKWEELDDSIGQQYWGHLASDAHKINEMHFHFLLDEVFLPEQGIYAQLNEPFVFNVTLDATYGVYALDKVRTTNCYITEQDVKLPAQTTCNRQERNENGQIPDEINERRRVASNDQHNNNLYYKRSKQDSMGDGDDGGNEDALLSLPKVSGSADSWNSNNRDEQSLHPEINLFQQRHTVHINSNLMAPTAAAATHQRFMPQWRSLLRALRPKMESHQPQQPRVSWEGRSDDDYFYHYDRYPDYPRHHTNPGEFRSIINNNPGRLQVPSDEVFNFREKPSHPLPVAAIRGNNAYRYYQQQQQHFFAGPVFYGHLENIGHHLDTDAGASNEQNVGQPDIKNVDQEADPYLQPNLRSPSFEAKSEYSFDKQEKVSHDTESTMKWKRYTLYRVRKPLIALEYPSTISIVRELSNSAQRNNDAVIVGSTRLTSKCSTFTNQFSHIRLETDGGSKFSNDTTSRHFSKADHLFSNASSNGNRSDGFNPVELIIIDPNRPLTKFLPEPSRVLQEERPDRRAVEQRPSINWVNFHESENRGIGKLDKLQPPLVQQEQQHQHQSPPAAILISNDVSLRDELDFGSIRDDVFTAPSPMAGSSSADELHNSFSIQNRHLICPDLDIAGGKFTVQSVSQFYGSSLARLGECGAGICLQAPIAVSAAYRYTIQLAYSVNQIVLPDPGAPAANGLNIKIVKVVTSFQGPLVQQSSSDPASLLEPVRYGHPQRRYRRPRRKLENFQWRKGHSKLVLELALMNVNPNPGQQHRRELALVNIDINCLLLLSSIVAGDPKRYGYGHRVWLRPQQLQTVRMHFPIDGKAVLTHREQFECQAFASLIAKYSPETSGMQIQPSMLPQTAQVKRKFLIKPGGRCVCSDFFCKCACLLGLATLVAPVTTAADAKAPGAADDGNCRMINVTSGAGNAGHTESFFYGILIIILLLVGVLLALGCAKAFCGCFYESIGKWRYDYLQPTVEYRDSSRCRRFLMNTIFFVVYPCVLCCHYFDRSNILPDESNDRLLQQQGLLAGTSLVQKRMSYSVTSNDEWDHDKMGDGWENSGRQCRADKLWDSRTRTVDSSDDELTRLVWEIQSAEVGGAGSSDGYSNTEDEAKDTSFVLKAMDKSRRSLQTLNEIAIAKDGSDDCGTEQEQEAADIMVRELLDAKIVYRRLTGPCGQALVSDGQSYSVQGYFIGLSDTRYQFFTHATVKQFWELKKDPQVMIHGTATPAVNNQISPKRNC
ncbi:uncharacterized protein LOC129718642 isoform X2 [Wyeomyia smithii]|uniref:uncharacterized protein LOC129718642 isoform X2 n=1 Tax=Wyeomyia smithii TaxID=174621 RepID=UPI002467C5F1|nr:uncharacterized protein LOC129718642 isoform X2 [Wyeomyia smithii]